MRLDALIIVLIAYHTKCFTWGVSCRDTKVKRITNRKKNMRLDALIIFLIGWPQEVLYLKD